MSIQFHNKIGFGAMGLTLGPPTSEEQAFETLKVAIDNGADLINSGEFYGHDPKESNLILLTKFFTKYPELRSKVKISVKGAFDMATQKPDGSKEGIAKSINNILKFIDYIDIFECARVDDTVPIEDTIGYIKEFITAGKVGGVSLSESGAETIKKAASVYPISFVEVEFSMWATHILKDGVYDTCLELGIPILAYSPLGKGFLSGSYLKFEDTEALGPARGMFQKFSDKEIFDHNVALAEKVKEWSSKKGVTMAQFALAWILTFKNIVPIPGTSKPSRVLENLKAADVPLTAEETKEVNDFLAKFEVKGYRYNAEHDQLLMK